MLNITLGHPWVRWASLQRDSQSISPDPSWVNC